MTASERTDYLRKYVRAAMKKFDMQNRLIQGLTGRDITPREMGERLKNEMFLLKDIELLTEENQKLRSALEELRVYFSEVQKVLDGGIKE